MSIKIVYSPFHKKHSPKYELFDGKVVNHVEVPRRIEKIVEVLKVRGFKIIQPKSFLARELYDIHRKKYVSFIRRASSNTIREFFPKKYSFDSYTPITAGTFDAALASASVAKIGADLLLSGESLVYSLCRPPGHHASFRMMGGYCYFNNAAIAANSLVKTGKVSILDIDFHHGNGTQEIFYERDDVLFVSIHADPRWAFPYSTGFGNERGLGKGRGYNFNFPLPLKTTPDLYLKRLNQGLEKIRRFGPNFLIISAGFDTYLKDPIGGFGLSINTFKNVAAQISSLNLPTLAVQEGGYCVKDLDKISLSFLSGFDSSPL